MRARHENLTVLIVARNAAATVARAVRSAVMQHADRIVLVDHRSDDATAQRAIEAGAGVLEVVDGGGCPTLGAARQRALDVVQTPFAVWLDADDEFLNGRLARISRALHDGAEIVADAAELADGGSGAVKARLAMPAFLHGGRLIARLFERNHLPAPGPIGFRCDRLRALGYDRGLRTAEDIDILLRAVVDGAVVRLLPQAGYRIHSYPDSQSRQLDLQRASYAAALRKHRYTDVAALCRRAGMSEPVVRWSVVSMATFAEDYATALRTLEMIAADTSDGTTLLESDGPWPWPEHWRIAFHRGTLLLLTGEVREALDQLERAAAIDAGPEVLNNLGVALARCGMPREAAGMFSAALEIFPGFRDARLNRRSPAPPHVTTHPLRQQPARRDYVLTEAAV